jgi:wyosine [tRNA(Phe)-imidazoG37] synthetase (radical SAM superfamily)
VIPAVPLSVEDHRRDAAGMRYVYPVVSRRAGGVSIGINLNPNGACNWRCLYCQVPGLTRGGPPPIDLGLLADELERMLHDIRHGDFMIARVPADLRRLADVAFSGNGEPTSAKEFPAAVAAVEKALQESGLAGRVKVRLITNGSLVDRIAVREGIAHIGRIGGEVWFKIDAGTATAMARINGVPQKPATVLRRLATCAGLCETWVQSCFFALDGVPPDEAEIAAYLEMLATARQHVAGVHLYGLARPSQQPEAPRLGRLSPDWLGALAGRMRTLGLTVQVSP